MMDKDLKGQTEYTLVMLDGCKKGLILKWKDYPPLELYFPIRPPITFDIVLLKEIESDLPKCKQVVYKLVRIYKEVHYAFYRQKEIRY